MVVRDKSVNGPIARLLQRVWVLIKSIQILSQGIYPPMTPIDPVRVDHRDNTEDKMVQNRMIFKGRKHPVHEMTRRDLPWMYPSTHKNNWF